jgi:hypothetical protein
MTSFDHARQLPRILLCVPYRNARLTEMRKQLLIRPKSQELPGANCEVAIETKPITAGKFGIGRDSPLCNRSLTPRSREAALSRRGRQPA